MWPTFLYTLIVKCLWNFLTSAKYRQDETLEFCLKSCRGEIMKSISIVRAFHGMSLELVVLLIFKVANKALLSLFIMAVYKLWWHFEHGINVFFDNNRLSQRVSSGRWQRFLADGQVHEQVKDCTTGGEARLWGREIRIPGKELFY